MSSATTMTAPLRTLEAGLEGIVTTSGGFGHLMKGHGVAFGDIDHDANQDVYMVLGGAYRGDLSDRLARQLTTG